MKKATIQVYLDNGLVYSYDIVESSAEQLAAKAREHAGAIIATGYRSCGPTTFTHYPPHRILKVKIGDSVVTTDYPDRVSGT